MSTVTVIAVVEVGIGIAAKVKLDSTAAELDRSAAKFKAEQAAEWAKTHPSK